ncbi:MAG: DUF6758 family protein [Marmoricola sp.]
MLLVASCPRCTAPVASDAAGHLCPVHGRIEALWRPTEADYDSFAELVGRSEDLPTYLPWPMSPGWSISDFGCVGREGRVRATVTTTVGNSDLDGAVEVTIVSEEPGVGLGARCSGTSYDDPGPQISNGPPAVKVRAGGRAVSMWLVEDDDSAAGDGDDFLTQAVFAGEAEGRWLWLVMKPASAAMLLQDSWLLADVTGFGPEALEMPFGGPRPTW